MAPSYGLEPLDSRLAPALLLGPEGEALFDSSAFPMLVVDRTRRIWQVNPAMIAFSGLRQQQLVGLKLGDALRCENAHRTPWGCGGTSGCGDCPLRLAVEACLAQGGVHSGRSVWTQVEGSTEARRRCASYAVTPLAWPNPRTVLVTLESVASPHGP